MSSKDDINVLKSTKVTLEKYYDSSKLKYYILILTFFLSIQSHSGSSNSDSNNKGGSNMCLELALEGERLCKSGDCRAGVAFFQAAIQAGTKDLKTLSAIYSQMGNAYYYLGDYQKSVQYHKHDLTLARYVVSDK